MTILAWQRGGFAGGPAVLLLHGWASDGRSDFEATGWVAALAHAGYDVLVPDLPGHAESGDVVLPSNAEPAAWSAGVVVQDLDRMGVGLVRPVGYAEGCLVAGHLAARRPERMRPLVLLSRDDRLGLPGGAQIAALLRGERHGPWDAEAADVAQVARRDPRHHAPSLAAWVERAAWPAAPRLGALDMAVLLAVGTEDAHREGAPRLAQLFRDARLVTVPGDERTMLAEPGLVEAVVAFLKEHDA